MSRHPWTVTTAPQGAPSPTLRTPGVFCRLLLRHRFPNTGSGPICGHRNVVSVTTMFMGPLVFSFLHLVLNYYFKTFSKTRSQKSIDFHELKAKLYICFLSNAMKK